MVRAWIVALATPVGALISYFSVQSVDEALLDSCSPSQQALLYMSGPRISSRDPQKFQRSNIVLVLLGVSLVYFVSIFLGGH